MLMSAILQNHARGKMGLPYRKRMISVGRDRAARPIFHGFSPEGRVPDEMLVRSGSA